ncbi:hypothetical protein J5N97_020768 [Dioscorea zingiberensis]|uniref:Small ribosomal subunit protein mS38 n=1 Tax=Dioscorea zingiberensis TaxID=325984 RepID=A0A9D5CH78_9LILI|nr:hypothetical protein J5N97_020768 [Dioscorea zingiberensis]
MASLLQKLVKKPYLQPLRFLPSFQNPHFPDPPPLPPLLHSWPLPNPSPNPNPINRIPIYPSFPHWCHLEPISISGIDPSDIDGGAEIIEADQRTVWADSVKKKRKKKMNKHKYRKLRKRLRRQT